MSYEEEDACIPGRGLGDPPYCYQTFGNSVAQRRHMRRRMHAYLVEALETPPIAIKHLVIVLHKGVI